MSTTTTTPTDLVKDTRGGLPSFVERSFATFFVPESPFYLRINPTSVAVLGLCRHHPFLQGPEADSSLVSIELLHPLAVIHGSHRKGSTIANRGTILCRVSLSDPSSGAALSTLELPSPVRGYLLEGNTTKMTLKELRNKSDSSGWIVILLLNGNGAASPDVVPLIQKGLLLDEDSIKKRQGEIDSKHQ